MNVHFIDTSVLLEILQVPNKNSNHEKIMNELQQMVEGKDTLILPFATIIETGNHIAQNGNGQQKRSCADRFVQCILKTIDGQAPWSYYGEQLTKEDLRGICSQFCDYAMRGEGFGDLSIISAYERYKKETPAISRIRIWSLDNHLQSYDEVLHTKSRRNK